MNLLKIELSWLDDKQRPSGDMIRKQFIVFPVVSPLSPDLIT